MSKPTDKQLEAWQAVYDAALRKAEQLASIADDWDLDKVEIDGGWVSTWDLKKEFVAARTGWPVCIEEVQRLRKVETAGDELVEMAKAYGRPDTSLDNAIDAYDAAKRGGE